MHESRKSDHRGRIGWRKDDDSDRILPGGRKEKNVSRRQKYFLKQKLFGAGVLAFTAISIPLLDGEATHAILLVPIGLYMIFTKEMCLYDSYYQEIKERRRKQQQMNKALMHRFISEVYGGDRNKYRQERKDDYCRVQYIWTCWIDALCKDGEITDRQWRNATF